MSTVPVSQFITGDPDYMKIDIDFTCLIKRNLL